MTVAAHTSPRPLAQRPPLLRLAGVEARKMADTRSGVVLLALAGLVGVAVAALTTATDPAHASFTDVLHDVVQGVAPVLGLVTLLLVTAEWSQRTGLTTFSLVPARNRVLTAKVVASLWLAAAGMVLVLAASAVAAAIDGGDFNGPAGQIGDATLFLAINVAVGLALGTAVMSTIPALVGYFALPTVVGVVGAISGGVLAVTSWIDQNAFLVLAEPGNITGQEWAKVGTATLAWVAVPAAIGLIRVRRSELK